MDAKRFGRRVRAFRKLKRISQIQLAESIHISTSTLGRIERGEKMPNEKYISMIAEQLNIEQHELIGKQIAE